MAEANVRREPTLPRSEISLICLLFPSASPLRRYKAEVRVSLIVYMHRITDNRMVGAPYKNLRMFGKLCGENAIGNVILTTIMWGNLQKHRSGLGELRETDLREKFWNGMHGSVVKRFYNTYESAWEVLNALDRAPVELLIQEEM